MLKVISDNTYIFRCIPTHDTIGIKHFQDDQFVQPSTIYLTHGKKITKLLSEVINRKMASGAQNTTQKKKRLNNMSPTKFRV